MAKAKKAKTSKVKRRKIASKPLKKVTTKLKKAVKKVSKKPVSKPVAAPAPAPLPGERIGVVTHYFAHLSVAVVKLDPDTALRIGDNIHIKGHTSDFGQRVESVKGI